MRVFWEYLTVENLEQLNRVEATFLERTLELHIVTQSHLTYLLGYLPLLFESLRGRS